jgi:beta-N-acetylhexosaminidase
VQRFRQGFTRLPPMQMLGQLVESDPATGLQLAEDTGWLMAQELLCAGVDISFAPVLDVDRGLSEVIGDRSFSGDFDRLIRTAEALMSGMHDAGMATTGKHFPGHGAVAADSHHEIPVDPRAFEQIEQQDLKPFAQVNGLDAVMPAHVIYERCDDKPAGFSPFWLQEILRRRLGFKGVIFSDDLSMAGARVAGGFAERAEAALQAGCDMVLVCNHRAGTQIVLEYLERTGAGPAIRVPSMKGRLTLENGALPSNERWQNTRSQLEALLVSGVK